MRSVLPAWSRIIAACLVKKDECCGGVSIALGCEWNVLNGLDYHDRPPCLRGARLAETNDGNRLEPFRVDVTSLALASLRSRSGKPLEPSFHHLGRPKCRYHWGLVPQIGMECWIGSSARFVDWLVAR